jgi:hypothetical protein
MQFKPLQPNVEINGHALSFTVAGFRLLPSVGLRFLEKYGLVDARNPRFDSEAWYPQEKWLRCFEAICNEVGTSTMTSIGRELGKRYPLPPPVTDLHGALQWLDAGFHLAHRKLGKPMFDAATGRMMEGIGHYGYERLGEREARSECDNPYPCDFDIGILTGLAERFAARARVVHAGSGCRKHGASCSYLIRW